MKKDPIISFCIPTYNRPKEFERMIAGLIPQLSSDVEVVIRDDSSNFDTKTIVEKRLKDKFDLQYFKGEKIGLDLANLFLLEKARGRYVWWFSDDDEILPGGISRALGILTENPEIDFMWANFTNEERSRLAVNRKEGFFETRDEVIDALGTSIGLLSTLIIKRSEGLKYLELGKQRSKGFCFAALIPVLGSLSGMGKYYFLRGPYIINHPTTVKEIKEIVTRSGQIKNDGFDVYGVNFYEIMNLFEKNFGKGVIKKSLKKNFSYLWRGILVGWVLGYDTPKGKRWKMFKLYWSFGEFWLALPLLLLPKFVNKIFYKIYKIFFSERKWRWKLKF